MSSLELLKKYELGIITIENINLLPIAELISKSRKYDNYEHIRGPYWIDAISD